MLRCFKISIFFIIILVFNIVKLYSSETIILSPKETPVFIDKDFYGVNISPHVPLPDPKTLRELGVGIMRIGGNEYDAYNWENSYVYNPEYGYVKMQTLEEIVEILLKADVEPLFQINMSGNYPLQKDGKWTFKNKLNLDSFKKLLKKFNSKKITKIKNFSLGNEFNHWTETHKYFYLDRKYAFSADEYINLYKSIVLELRGIQKSISGNANDIKIWGPEISSSFNGWQTENTKKDCKWSSDGLRFICEYGKQRSFTSFIPYFLRELKDFESDKKNNINSYKMIDYLTFHYYPIFRTSKVDPKSILKINNSFPIQGALNSAKLFYSKKYHNKYDVSSPRSNDIGTFINFNKWVKNNYPGLKIGLTEFGIDSDDRVFSYPSELRPLYLANMIGASSQNNIAFLNKFRLNSVTPNIAPWSLIIDGKKTKLFHVMKLFTQNYRGEILNSSLGHDSDIKIYASILDGDYNVFLLNLSKKNQDVDFEIRGKKNAKGKVIKQKVKKLSLKYFKIDQYFNVKTTKSLSF